MIQKRELETLSELVQALVRECESINVEARELDAKLVLVMPDLTKMAQQAEILAQALQFVTIGAEAIFYRYSNMSGPEGQCVKEHLDRLRQCFDDTNRKTVEILAKALSMIGE